MKRIVLLIIYAILAAMLLCGCRAGAEPSQKVPPLPSPATSPAADAGSSPDGAVETHCSDELMAVLRGEKEIVFHSYLYSQSDDGRESSYVSSGEFGRCYIGNLGEMLNPSGGRVPVSEYAEVDLDGDGSQELILRVDNLPGACSYGYVILRDAGGSVNGYLFYKNGVDCFKQDGTFIMPGNSYRAVAGISFVENGYTLTVFADIDYADGVEPRCTIDGAAATPEAAQEYMDRQSEKPDVVWRVFEDEKAVS